MRVLYSKAISIKIGKNKNITDKKESVARFFITRVDVAKVGINTFKGDVFGFIFLDF